MILATRVSYLGYQVSEEGIALDILKVLITTDPVIHLRDGRELPKFRNCFSQRNENGKVHLVCYKSRGL